jgi:hypothetical protein
VREISRAAAVFLFHPWEFCIPRSEYKTGIQLEEAAAAAAAAAAAEVANGPAGCILLGDRGCAARVVSFYRIEKDPHRIPNR